MLNQNQLFGKEGESLAASYLKKNGYQILEQNYKNKIGEIDIIAKDKDTIVFIEVKSRKNYRFGNPKYAVTLKKQKKLYITATSYLKSKKLLRSRARFDVVTVKTEHNKTVIEIIKNAFANPYM